MDRRDNPAETAPPIRKQVDVLDLPLDSQRYLAVVEPYRNQEDIVQRLATGTLERIPDLRLEVPFLLHRVAGETGDEEVGSIDGVFDAPRPILAG
ncbi:MAG: hypothetical protein WD696_13940 [Bryobacteraceae bacterium]